MSSIPPISARTSTLQRSNQVLAQLRRTHTQLADIERQATTGLKYGTPSQGADKAPSILFLRQQLAAREQYFRNLDHSLGMLNTTDATLREINDILLDAKTGALGQIGLGADADSRNAQALIVDSQIAGLLELANQQYQGISLFGGTGGDKPQGPAFEEFLGGIRYTGSARNLHADTGSPHSQPYNTNGIDAFGALSARVASMVNLQPQTSADTRISDLGGATGQGVRLGTVRVTVNGTSANVDLQNSDTLGDITTRINHAINQLGGTGSLDFANQSLALTANPGETITIENLGQGKAANDLGIQLTANATTTPATTVGPSVNPKLSDQTALANLNPTIDWASGLLITQGEHTAVADFASAQTVQDLKNTIRNLNLGLRMEINADGTGLNLVSEVSGLDLSIGENGGTTASDLGLRTLGDHTRLSDFNHGRGIQTTTGDDLKFTLSDGTTFTLDIDGLTTVAELVNAINTTAAGNLTVNYETTGNGLVFTDHTAGTNDFTIASINESQAAHHLGIAQTVAAGQTIHTGDQAQVRVDSVFTHLIDLSKALRTNNESGITLATEQVDQALTRFTQVRASIGVEARRVEQEQARAEDRQLSEQTLLSNLQDADMTEVLTQYMQLQHQWQASLQIGAQNMQLSLLDYLR